MDETRTPGYRAVVKVLREPYSAQREQLYLNSYRTLFKIPPDISQLSELKGLILNNSPIQDLSPIAGLTGLELLVLDYTHVTDLTPLAHMTHMQDIAVQGAQNKWPSPPFLRDIAVQDARNKEPSLGLFYRRTPVSLKPPFDLLVQLDQPARTVETINEIRRGLGLQEHIPKGYKRLKELSTRSRPSLEALSGVPSAFGFQISDGTIEIASSSVNRAVFPFSTSEQDHRARLEVSSTLAKDLIAELQRGRFNARPDYLESLGKYVERLPQLPNEGNILLADAEARNIRNMFAADADILPVGFASKLKTLLEQHIGLRAYYPEIEHFYRDVKSGRLQTPLPLDALEGVVRTVEQHTPTVFDQSVTTAISASSEPAAETAETTTAALDLSISSQPSVPPRSIRRAKSAEISRLHNCRHGQRSLENISPG